VVKKEKDLEKDREKGSMVAYQQRLEVPYGIVENN
jgi:hypothetical protein